MRRNFLDWDEDIYQEGLQINRWPFTEVVSAFSRLMSDWNGLAAPRVLEVGFGTGNNLWFLADAGFTISGIEYSSTAVAHARARLDSLEFSSDLRVGDFRDLPFNDNSFDFVLDRAALTHTAHEDVRAAAAEIHRVLAPRGELHSFTLFGEGHPTRRLGTDIDPDATSRLGTFRSYFSETDLRELFSIFRLVTMSRVKMKTDGVLVGDEYRLVAEK